MPSRNQVIEKERIKDSSELTVPGFRQMKIQMQPNGHIQVLDSTTHPHLIGLAYDQKTDSFYNWPEERAQPKSSTWLLWLIALVLAGILALTGGRDIWSVIGR